MKSILTYLGTLFRHKDKIVGTSPTGFPLVEGWEKSPEEEILNYFNQFTASHSRDGKLALYCYEGPHRGEVVMLNKEVETLGASTISTRAVTSTTSHEFPHYQLLLNQNFRLLAERGYSFRLNGSEVQEGNLFNFDELDLLENRFLVLDLTEKKWAAPEVAL